MEFRELILVFGRVDAISVEICTLRHEFELGMVHCGRKRQEYDIICSSGYT